jgi:hypothetical protein
LVCTQASSKYKITILAGLKNFQLSFSIVGLFFLMLQLWLATAHSRLAESSILKSIGITREDITVN